MVILGGLKIESSRLEDKNEYEYENEIWLKVFARDIKTKRHHGKLHFTFFH